LSLHELLVRTHRESFKESNNIVNLEMLSNKIKDLFIFSIGERLDAFDVLRFWSE
jgi:hypothetical protein